jgi:hypothetical protein
MNGDLETAGGSVPVALVATVREDGDEVEIEGTTTVARNDVQSARNDPHPRDAPRQTVSAQACSLSVPGGVVGMYLWAKSLQIAVLMTLSVTTHRAASPQATQVAELQDFQALFRTRTGDPLLTMNVRRGPTHADLCVAGRVRACR